ncbi:DNA-binding anti-repressor SinI [Jeotgalibacillus marinus]|uniref:DNA-binding anti-repressor SinI n=1 Tax=Jeotgalibacillus marinus TaxID=86667 RepID=A0ABV3Q4Q1_9BACL
MGQTIELDLEWVALIQEALGAGITEQEINDCLKGNDCQ